MRSYSLRVAAATLSIAAVALTGLSTTANAAITKYCAVAASLPPTLTPLTMTMSPAQVSQRAAIDIATYNKTVVALAIAPTSQKFLVHNIEVYAYDFRKTVPPAVSYAKVLASDPTNPTALKQMKAVVQWTTAVAVMYDHALITLHQRTSVCSNMKPISPTTPTSVPPTTPTSVPPTTPTSVPPTTPTTVPTTATPVIASADGIGLNTAIVRWQVSGLAGTSKVSFYTFMGTGCATRAHSTSTAYNPAANTTTGTVISTGSGYYSPAGPYSGYVVVASSSGSTQSGCITLGRS